MTGTIIAVSCFIAAIIWGILAGRKRQSSLTNLAEELGLGFSVERNYQLPDQFSCLSDYEGTNRFACPVFKGKHNGLQLIAFDLHYDTGSGRRTRCIIMDETQNKVLFTSGKSISKENLKDLLQEIGPSQSN